MIGIGGKNINLIKMKYLIYRVKKLYKKDGLKSSESIRSMMMGYFNYLNAFLVVSFWISFPTIIDIETYKNWYFLTIVIGFVFLTSFLVLFFFDKNIDEKKFSRSRLNYIFKDWMLIILPILILGITIVFKFVIFG